MMNFAAYRPILSLLRGTAFLLAASGLHGLLLAACAASSKVFPPPRSA